MSTFNPKYYHRKSIRLKEYDYSQEGLYFITICCHNKSCLLGEIIDSKMHLNEAGNIVKECWLDIPKHFSNVILHEFIIMPNHIHGIIELVGANQHSPKDESKSIQSVGANQHSPNDKNKITTDNMANIDSQNMTNIDSQKRANIDSPLRSPSKTIGSVIRGFKIGVTKWIRQNSSVYNVWQRNYYEHIIRNDQSYINISEYITTNPQKWLDDTFYIK
jgi:REP element-mobilizing transposase RayT